MKRAYLDNKFLQSTLDLINSVNVIIEEYLAQGFTLTLRQLHYQFVSRDLYANTIENYNRLGTAVSKGREAGLISWTAIEDRGRNLMGLDTWTNPAAAVKEMRKRYRRDLWERQPCRPEVWIEKQALEGVIGKICNDLRVDFFATRGYNSQSEQWRAGRRFAGYYQKGQRPIVLHLGDHDPSGIDMTRDNRERLELFCGAPVHVIRLALNMEQVEEIKPPPNFAKDTDSRFAAYEARYGSESWELDALDPVYINNLIEETVAKFRDEATWEKSLEIETNDKDQLDMVIERL